MWKNKPVPEPVTPVPGFLFPCRHKGGSITIFPLVTGCSCLLRLKMGHMVVIFPPAVCKDSGSLSKERIWELNPMSLHTCCSCSMESFTSGSFLIQQDVTRCSILRVSFLHSFSFPEIKTPNVIPQLELLALTPFLTVTIMDSSQDHATICGCLICLDPVIDH